MSSLNPSDPNHLFASVRMRTVLQRCSQAEVKVGDQSCGKLKAGLMLLIGFSSGTGQLSDSDLGEMMSCSAERRRQILEPLFRRWWDKVTQLRIFTDSEGKMNQSLVQQSAEFGVYLVSQFTLYADLKKGHRPSYTNALPGVAARLIFEDLVVFARQCSLERPVFSGIFAADMAVSLINDGPVTLVFDSSIESGNVSL